MIRLGGRDSSGNRLLKVYVYFESGSHFLDFAFVSSEKAYKGFYYVKHDITPLSVKMPVNLTWINLTHCAV